MPHSPGPAPTPRRKLAELSAVTTRVTIDGHTYAVDDPEDVVRLLDGAEPVEVAEVLLERDDGALLLLMLSEPRAVLVYQRRAGDPQDAGQIARDPRYRMDADTFVEIRFSSGRIDRHPIGESVPRADALRAAEHFVATGGRAPWIAWLDDNQPSAGL